MEPLVLEFVIPSMREQKIHDQLTAVVRLYDDRIEYDMSFYCDETSEKDDSIWEKDVYREFSTVYKKEAVIGISQGKNATEDCWYVKVYTRDGRGLEINEVDEQRCKDMTKRIKDWLFLPVQGV